MGRSRSHARGVHGSARLTVSIVLGLLLVVGASGYAAYRYDSSTAGTLLPGVTIGGVEVGEMSRAEAIELLEDEAEERLGREVQIAARDQTWTVTAAALGTTPMVEPVVNKAIAARESYSWPERVFRRVFNTKIAYSSDLHFKPDRQRIRAYLEGVAGDIAQEPTNAEVEYENGEVTLRKPEAGWQLPVDDAVRAVRLALAGGSETVRLPLQKIAPEVTREDLGYTIVVDLGDLELTLYDGLHVDRTYPVAAGSPSYPTPQGDWEIINKRINPTWTNPAPDGWGKDMPLSIGPGPGNPLGTRALDLNAPGIRIHGTPASYSIGSYASHGCVRMLMSDVEELFDIVPVGTQVHIVP
jgi:lipoprotein-anchoring transpeptidase ErfK/SrfK